MNEIWKDLKGYREIYQVSNLGNVRTKERIGARGYFVKSRELTKFNNNSGYYRVCIRLESDVRTKYYFVHRLVGMLFIPHEDGKDFINHIDGDKHNNSVENLEWCTRSENMNNPLTKEKCREMNKGKHRSEETKKKISESGKGRILSEESKKKIGKGNGKLVYCIELDKMFESTCEASRELGISQSSISLVCRGKRKTAGGYHWEYVDSE